MSEVSEFIRERYKKFAYSRVGEYNLEEAWGFIHPELMEAVKTGSLQLDLNDIGWKALKLIDDSMVQRGKRIMKKEDKRAGSGQMSLDGGAWLDVLIPLGKNERVMLRHVGYEEYKRATSLRDDNRRAANREFNCWVNYMAPFAQYFSQGYRVGQVVDHGWVTEDDLDWNDGGELD